MVSVVWVGIRLPLHAAGNSWTPDSTHRPTDAHTHTTRNQLHYYLLHDDEDDNGPYM